MRKFNNRYDHSTWLLDKIIVFGAVKFLFAAIHVWCAVVVSFNRQIIVVRCAALDQTQATEQLLVDHRSA